jgi:hypothetical protein
VYETVDLEAVQALIGTFKTTVSAGNNGRNQNIITALSKINDVVLQPGEVFSTNQQFGRMSYDNGYRMAPVIVNGRLEDGMGGGICQVSSTLYMAVLHAELEVVERRNHSLKVTYMDWGFDATLAGDVIDFKFKNNIDSPVFIEAILINGTEVTINIFGRETRPPHRSISFTNRLTATVQPSEQPLETFDASLAPGERRVKQRAAAGHTYDVYKTIYEHGVEVDSVHINTSRYRAARGEVLVGPALLPGEEAPPESVASNGSDTATDANNANNANNVDNADGGANTIDIDVYDPESVADPWDLPVMPSTSEQTAADEFFNNWAQPGDQLITDPQF